MILSGEITSFPENLRMQIVFLDGVEGTRFVSWVSMIKKKNLSHQISCLGQLLCIPSLLVVDKEDRFRHQISDRVILSLDSLWMDLINRFLSSWAFWATMLRLQWRPKLAPLNLTLLLQVDMLKEKILRQGVPNQLLLMMV